MKFNRILSAATAVAAFTAIPVAADDHGAADTAAEPVAGNIDAPAMSARDLVTMPRVGGASVAMGRFAVFSVTYTDEETLSRSRQHYMLDLSDPGADPIAFDLGLPAFAMTFGADNHLYFLSTGHTDDEAEPRSRLWRAALKENGTFEAPMIVADIAGSDIAGFKLSPTGNAVAMWSEIARDCPGFGCEDEAERIGSGRLYESDGGFFRHWDRWDEPGIYNRVFLFDIEDGQISGEGAAIDGGTAGGIVGNTPTMPFGGAEDIAWAPDGSGVYFVAREANGDEPTSTDHDIYYFALGGSVPQILTDANAASDTSPAPSPDGRYLAYLAMARPGYESDRQVIQMRDLATGNTRALTQHVDLSFGGLSWSADGTYLLASAAEVLDTPVFKIDPNSGKTTRLNLIAGNEAHIGNVVSLPDDRLLFTRDSIGVPNEMFLAESGRTARPLTDFVTSRMGDLATTVTTRFSFEGANGDTVWGQITRLEEQAGSIPAILYIHGGPQGSFRDGWSSRWNPRVVASQGYAVISIDFHGSAGYGQEFMDSINRDWGGKPLEDLQKGLAAALALDPQIDVKRACAMGASYGGYMVNWIAGNWPDRFDCLVQHDGLFDMRSFYYSTEELWFPRWDFGGSYADAREEYERWNPVNHIDKWQTPMLVIAGENDFRVPYTQGLQSFTALQERGVPSQLLVFPDENHWVLGARNSLQWHETVFAWLNRWLTEENEAK